MKFDAIVIGSGQGGNPLAHNLADKIYAQGEFSGQPVLGRPRSVELSLNAKF